MSRTVKDKVVIVTGASSGIGAATAREFARQGARVVLAARRIDALTALVSEITNDGGQAIAITTDLTDTAQVMQLVERTQEAYGRIDILVNNAGINWEKHLVETSIDEIAHMLQANLLGMMVLTRAVLPEMQQRHRGAIISVGSVASHVALEPLYAATKFGVRGFSLALRRQLIGSGISVSLVTPGNIRTQMTRALQEQMPEPESIATTIVQLAVSPRREIIVPLKYHGIVWLDRLFPGVADFAYHWRHRHDRKPGKTGTMPAYAKSAALKIPE
ncbi:MAG: SDR family NAD(P)-dependent oxidoreductase [Ktedonobacteraceae bacterium]